LKTGTPSGITVDKEALKNLIQRDPPTERTVTRISMHG